MQSKTLFSDHYLQNRLPSLSEWSEEVRPAFDTLRQWMQKAQQDGNTWNEAQTEEELIKPILKLLGWSFIVQPKARRAGQVSRPDYALFADEASKAAAQPFQGQDEAFYGRTLAIAEAKHWGRPLSQQDRSGRATWKAESNPSHQMVSYLVGTRTPWGILTNGQIWRLYSREVSSTASEFYEINLGVLFDSLPPGREPSADQLDLFRRWWLFFRQAAFVPDAQGKSFVQRVHEGSATYAREISERLKELVFQEVMPEIAGGFVAYRRQQIHGQQETPETLDEIYRASLSLLYKLLFLLYAEARALLPMENSDYRANSLTAIAEWAAAQIDQKRNLSEATYATPRYDALLALFRRVDMGDKALGIPHYNGGLFNPNTPENRFLERYKLSDRAVAHAIDRLVRDQGQPVDYAYISVRNLGAIYEGLLENKLKLIDASGGRVELVNDKGERKATGSYYTPDYIVEYIVQHTLDPILEARGAEYEQAMARIVSLRKALLNVSDSTTARRQRAELEEAENQAREAFLGIKVLDPAMGSGHFLVNAVDHLTDGIIQRMQAYHDAHPEACWEWDPIQRLIEHVRAKILKEMAEQGLSVDARRLDDTALLTRLVMKRCIYGVDLNRMAVELAKVSLWLHSFTVGAPLSFLDHHLRWGNSLIGADVRTVESAIHGQEQKGGASQLNLFAGPFAGLLDLTAVMTEVAERADATLADVHQSAKDYDGFQRSLTPYKQILDLWVSQYFGNKEALEFLTLFGNDVLPALRGEKAVVEKYRLAIENARHLRNEKRFFHWDLEFPEVFIDLRRRDWAENGGFDAVIGNPPYVRQEGLREDKAFFQSGYESYHSSADLYVYFIDRGITICHEFGYMGLIVSNKFMRASYGKPVRKSILSKAKLLKIIDFGELPVFSQAATFPVIMVLVKDREIAEQTVEIAKIKNLNFSNLDSLVQETSYPVGNSGLLHDGWSLSGQELSAIIGKMNERGIPLFKYLGMEPFFGVKTGFNEAFIIDKGKKKHMLEKQQTCGSLIHPLVVGDDLRHYAIEFQDRYLIVVPSGWTREQSKISNEEKAWEWFSKNFSPIAEHLSQYEEQARERRDKGIFWWELRPCDYYSLIEKPKIVYPDIAKEPRFAFDENGFYPINTIYFLPVNDPYLLAVLNSRLSFFYMQQMSSVLGDAESGGRLRFFGQYMSRLPIYRINSVSPDNLRNKKMANAYLLYEIGETNSLLAFVRQHLLTHVDIIRDILTHLAEQMIELNKERLAETKGFLAWLAREIGTPLDNLSGKTTIQNYLGDYQKGEEAASLQTILDVLRRNHRKLGVNVSGRAFQERLEQEYQASLAKLLPIKQKLSDTDRLIDQIVYALYGLTEDEIALVEGKA